MRKFLILYIILFFSEVHSQDFSIMPVLTPDYIIFCDTNIDAEPFYQGRYSLFLQKLGAKTNISGEAQLLKAVALLETGKSPQASEIFLSLTNNQNLNVKHTALLYMYQSAFDAKDFKSAEIFLNNIHQSAPGSPYKEIAHAKLIYLSFIQNDTRLSQILSSSFEDMYPESEYIHEIQYFIAANHLALGDTAAAKSYAAHLPKDNVRLQRLMGDIAIQEDSIDEALGYFTPIAEQYGIYQDEALYKSAILYKQQSDYNNAHTYLDRILKYHPNSRYYHRADAELASINILLQNYDDALFYYLRESSGTGRSKAFALLRTAEIHFLKGNTQAVQRTARRIQNEFPYSSFANESLYWLGRSYVLERNFADSIVIFDDYLLREPQGQKRDEIMIFLGHSYANVSDPAKSRYYFQEIVNRSTNDHLIRQALLGLGRSYNTQEPQRSLAYFDRVWQAYPDSAESCQALYYSAATRYNLRANDESLELFNKLISNYPESDFYPDSVLAVAKLQFKSDNFDGVLDMSAIEITKDNKELISEFKELQARSLFRVYRYEEALPLYAEAEKLTTNKTRKTDLFLAEASALRAMGRHKEAVVKYELYMKQNPEELIQAEIVYSYLEIPETAKAERSAAQLEDLFPNSVYLSDIYFKLADEFYAAQSYRKSARYYAKAGLYTGDKDLKGDILLREAWSRHAYKDSSTRNILEAFLTNHPEHFGVSDIKLKLAGMINTAEGRDAVLADIIESHPYSIEAEEARIVFADRLDKNTDLSVYVEKIANTSDKALKAKYMYKLAHKLNQEGDHESALTIFKDIHAMRDSVHGADSLLMAGDMLSQKEKYEDSLQMYIVVIAQYDEKYYSKSLDRIIQAYIFLEDYDNAEKFKERLLSQYPDSPESLKWLR